MAHPYYGLNELREMFLSYFEKQGHLRLPSFSLIPQNDKSLLLITRAQWQEMQMGGAPAADMADETVLSQEDEV